MSAIESPVLYKQATQEGTTLGQVLSFIQTNQPVEGYLNQPIYFGSVVVGYYSVYAINLPQNYSGNNSELLKGYIIMAQINDVPGGSTGINTSPMSIPGPDISTYGISTSFTGQLNFDIIDASTVQISMPAQPGIDACLVIGF